MKLRVTDRIITASSEGGELNNSNEGKGNHGKAIHNQYLLKVKSGPYLRSKKFTSAEGTNGLWKRTSTITKQNTAMIPTQFRALDSPSLDQGPRDTNFITLTHKTGKLKAMGVHK